LDHDAIREKMFPHELEELLFIDERGLELLKVRGKKMKCTMGGWK
jgi:hypothetical protein